MTSPRALVPLLALLLLVTAPPAAAHHGGTGDYEARSPVYLTGTVTEAYYGPPHALITLRVPDDARVPRELPGAGELRGREHWEGQPRVEGAGDEREILLPPDLTAEIGALSDRPEPGDEVSAIAYRRCADEDGSYGGELRVQLFYSGERRFAYGGTLTRIVPECEHAAADEPEQPAGAQGQEDGTAAGGDGDGLLGTVLVAGGVLAVVAAGFLLVRAVRTRAARR